MTISQAYDLAVQHHHAGRRAEAETLYRRILEVQPNHAGALHLLGLIAHQAGRHDLAVDMISRSIVFDPSNPIAHSNLGEAFRAIGRLDDALAACRRAIELKPDFPNAHLNLGNALRESGQLEEAASTYRRALQFKPDYPEAHNNLGNALKDQGQFEEAAAAYRRGTQFKSGIPDAHNNLGILLRDGGQLEEAIAAFRRALQLKPDFPDAHNNLGNALRALGQLDDAIAEYRSALRLKPDLPEAQSNLGIALREKGQFEEAIAAYRHALELKPDLPEAHNNLGITLAATGRLDEAIAAYRRALEIKPDYPDALNNLGTALKDHGLLDESIAAYRDALLIKPNDPTTHSNLVFALHFHPSHDESTISEERHRWNSHFCDPLKPFLLPHANDRSPDRPLRIGYVSPDFLDHVVGRNLIPLFERHDPRSIEILCYAGVMRPDRLTDEFRRRARQWRNTLGVADEALADMIRRDGVDILVDLSQHTAGNRLPMFARKPAPVQVSFAGYPGSAGLEAIEYRISDQYLEGKSAIEGAGREERVRLIDSFWCYDPCGVEVDVSGLPASETGTITFGCLNNFCKINERSLKLWARVLGQVTDSRFILLAGAGSHRQRSWEVFQREGVESDRVEFVGPRPRREYLELYHRLDIALDTFPYNGHTTSLDALWMGVPVVSLAGNTPVSRAGLSQLTNLGLPQLAAHSETEYVNIAKTLAGDIPLLTELRSTLRPRMKSSVLMDAPRFARNIENAYRSMWRAWCTGIQ